MKSMLFSIVLLAGVHSFACDQLVGAWQCSDSTGETNQETYAKVAGGLSVATTDENGTTVIIMDGAKHEAQMQGFPGSYTGSITCDANGDGVMNLALQVSANGQTVNATGVNKFSVRGNQLTEETTSTTPSETHTTQSTCTKM